MNILNHASNLIVAIVGLCLTGTLEAASDNDTEITRGASAIEQAPPPTVGEGGLDILGLTLGMTPEDVASAMESINAVQHLERRDTVRGTDIEFLAQQEWRRPVDEHPDDVSFRYADGIFVDYARPPSDPIVTRLIRSIQNTDPLPAEQIRTAIHDRYGEPSQVDELNSSTELGWYDGPNVEQCEMALDMFQSNSRATRQQVNEDCTGPWLRVGLRVVNSVGGRVERLYQITLRDDDASRENLQQFQAYQAEIAAERAAERAASAERERLQNVQVPDF